MSRARSSNRARFDWYWQKPFTDQKSPLYFDRTHWWIENPEAATEQAAWFELLRRHPSVYDVLTASEDDWKKSESSAHDIVWVLRRLLRKYALRPWPGNPVRTSFESVLPDLNATKGRDYRPLIQNLTQQAEHLADIPIGCSGWHERKLLDPERLRAWLLEAMQDISTVAALEFGNGNLIISIRWDIPEQRLADLKEEVARRYVAWQKENEIVVPNAGRDTTKDWFAKIQAFEESEQQRLFDKEGQRRKKPAQLKTNEKERRALQKLFDGIHF